MSLLKDHNVLETYIAALHHCAFVALIRGGDRSTIQLISPFGLIISISSSTYLESSSLSRTAHSPSSSYFVCIALSACSSEALNSEPLTLLPPPPAAPAAPAAAADPGEAAGPARSNFSVISPYRWAAAAALSSPNSEATEANSYYHDFVSPIHFYSSCCAEQLTSGLVARCFMATAMKFSSSAVNAAIISLSMFH